MDAKTASEKTNANLAARRDIQTTKDSVTNEYKRVMVDIEHAVFHARHHVRVWIFHEETTTKLEKLGFKIDALDDSSSMVMW
jgi:hypothetical protein